jgi:hypothetical protein
MEQNVKIKQILDYLIYVGQKINKRKGKTNQITSISHGVMRILDDLINLVTLHRLYMFIHNKNLLSQLIYFTIMFHQQ